MARVRDAGVALSIESRTPDKLKMVVDVYVDPLLYDQAGNLLTGGQPIHTAIKEYLKNLPFNGKFALALLVDEIQKVPGVILPNILQAEVSYGSAPFSSIPAIYTPDAGYLRFENEQDLVLNFLFSSPIV